MPVIESQFRPVPWLKNRHLQTLYPTFFQKRLKLPLKNERLELEDGDFLDLVHWPLAESPQALVLHGLEGSLKSHYATPFIKALHDAGFSVTFMHFRGCSGEPNRLTRRYHSGDTGDIHTVLELLSTRQPQQAIVLTGVSLGANALLKYLGEGGVCKSLVAAVSVSVPFDLANAAQTLQTGFARVYQRHLLTRLVKATQEKSKIIASPIDIGDLDKITTLYEFDDCVTAPLHGFASADDYYQQSSSRQYLNKINLPAHIIHALDDPFMTQDAIPDKNDLSEKVTLELASHGGHVGFVSDLTQGWLENHVADILFRYV